jgi:hypothetical protein
MAQKPLSLIYRETEQSLVQTVNDALRAGLPMFTVEPLIRLILKEAQQQMEQEHVTSMQQYQAELIAEQQQEEINETTGA